MYVFTAITASTTILPKKSASAPTILEDIDVLAQFRMVSVPSVAMSPRRRLQELDALAHRGGSRR